MFHKSKHIVFLCARKLNNLQSVSESADQMGKWFGILQEEKTTIVKLTDTTADLLLLFSLYTTIIHNKTHSQIFQRSPKDKQMFLSDNAAFL